MADRYEVQTFTRGRWEHFSHHPLAMLAWDAAKACDDKLRAGEIDDWRLIDTHTGEQLDMPKAQKPDPKPATERIEYDIPTEDGPPARIVFDVGIH